MRIHFLGIGGSGTSGAAKIAETQGYEITGCDLEPINEFTKAFKPDQLFKGHSASHLTSGNVDLLAITPAITSLDPKNPELLEAKKLGIPVMTWQEFLGEYLTKEKFVIAVAGTHGKSTTTAMIGKMMEDAGLDPTVELGAIVPKWNANYRVGRSKYFVIEADEYNDNFLSFKPDITVVTNIEMDHPEYFKDINAYLDSFEKFLLQCKQTIVANLKDTSVAEIIKDVMKQSKVSALDLNKIELNLNLQIPGEYNILNAKAAFQVGLLLGINPEIIRQSLNSYKGVYRRFEYIGDYHGAKVYSDFGHHPTEIKVTMEAVRQKFPKQHILLIFEPHMFTRTLALFDDFVKVFKQLPIDKIIITDIYQSREVDKGLVNSKQLADAVKKENVCYVSKEDLKNYLERIVKENYVVFFMGAGDIDKFATHFLN